MSEETGRMAEEDKFLGVRTTIEPPSEDVEQAKPEDFEVSVVDDRSKEDQRHAPLDKDGNLLKKQGQDLEEYGGKVKDRIGKLKREFHDERRAKEAAEAESNEAVSYSRAMQVENQRLLHLVRNSQAAQIGRAHV